MNKTKMKAEAAPAKSGQHTVPPESIATIQCVLNNAGESLRHTKRGESSDCFEAARRLNIIADERAALLEALKGMVAIHGPVATVAESVKALNAARAAIDQAEKGAQ